MEHPNRPPRSPERYDPEKNIDHDEDGVVVGEKAVSLVHGLFRSCHSRSGVTCRARM
jgi:hypothetical protein